MTGTDVVTFFPQPRQGITAFLEGGPEGGQPLPGFRTLLQQIAVAGISVKHRQLETPVGKYPCLVL